MIWKGILLLLLSSFLLAQSPQYFQSRTEFYSTASDKVNFSWTEWVDFECEWISSHTLRLQFLRFRAEGQVQDQSYQIDTLATESTHFDQIGLKRLVNTPLLVDFNLDYHIKKPIRDFQNLKELTFQHNTLFNEALVEKLISAILTPKYYDKENNLLPLWLYFPVSSQFTVSPNLSLQKKGSEIFFDQEVQLSAPFCFGETSTPIQMEGELSGEVQWDHQSNFVQHFHFSQNLQEKSLEPLYEVPLKFEYQLQVNQIKDE